MFNSPWTSKSEMKRRIGHFRRHRRQSGNMLILGSVVMAVVGLGLLIGYSYGGLIFTHNRLQGSADEIALAGARKLNENDRVGQMNNMIARSRQLVIESQINLDKVQSDYPQLQAIAEEQLEEAKDCASELDQQRSYLANLATTESLVAMEKKFDQIKGSYPMSLPWMKVGSPHLDKMRLGYLENIESNVEQLHNIKELEDHDQAMGFVKSGGKLKLYKQGVSKTLPAPNDSIQFYLSSLAAPVDKTVSPAHIVLSKAFQKLDLPLIPTCTKVEITLMVGTGAGGNASQKMKVESAAAATGASPQQ